MTPSCAVAITRGAIDRRRVAVAHSAFQAEAKKFFEKTLQEKQKKGYTAATPSGESAVSATKSLATAKPAPPAMAGKKRGATSDPSALAAAASAPAAAEKKARGSRGAVDSAAVAATKSIADATDAKEVYLECHEGECRRNGRLMRVSDASEEREPC